MKVAKRLNPAELATLPEGEHCDGGGLYLRVTGMGGRSWIYKYQWEKKQEKMGLGALADVGLSAARDKVIKFRAKILDGVNPKVERDAPKGASVRSSPTFLEFATEHVKTRTLGMKPKSKAKWDRTVDVYCDSLHQKQVHEITADDVFAVLAPRWQKNPQAMRNCRGHLQEILGAARVKGHRTPNEINPAQWDDNLKHMPFPKQARKGKVRGSHPAMDYADLPAFMVALRQKETVGAWCLETLVLCGVRTTEALQMQWSQINFAKRKWIIPGKAMKNGMEASVPLTETVLARLNEIKGLGLPGEYVFPGQKAGTMMSNNTMLKLLQKDLGRDDCTVHGFRTSFRSWGQNETTHSRETLEFCLHHIEGDATEAAYARGDMLEKRRSALKDWETFCNTMPAAPAEPEASTASHLRLVSAA